MLSYGDLWFLLHVFVLINLSKDMLIYFIPNDIIVCGSLLTWKFSQHLS